MHPNTDEVCDEIDHNCDGDPRDGIPMVTYWPDQDGDGHGDRLSDSVETCDGPPDAAFASNMEDCDDLDPEVHASAAEVCDGIDNDCDGSVDETLYFVTWYPDNDGDLQGVGEPERGVSSCAGPPGPGYVLNLDDCDDSNPEVHVGAFEQCDGLDNDCDGDVDEESVLHDYYQDGDGDGHGDPETIIRGCAAPDGYTGNTGDCDDSDAAVYPGAEEECGSGVDANCDGSAGDLDADRDGFPACEDCNDRDWSIYPGAEEACDGQDDDCSGRVDDIEPIVWYRDVDGDGYGDEVEVLEVAICQDEISGWVAVAGDCDDQDSGINPGAAEVCDASDNDCDGEIDEGLPVASWYRDADEDGYGSSADSLEACEAPHDYVEDDRDCDDTRSDVHPGAAESCDNSADTNCDGATGDEDSDGDTASACADCDDTDPSVYPEALEVCDGQDNNCDGAVDNAGYQTWYRDEDRDGYGGEISSTLPGCDVGGWVLEAGDCDDGDPVVHPTAQELCNGKDDDCDGDMDEGVSCRGAVPPLGGE